MNETESHSVWDILRQFGFELDDSTYSDGEPGLSFHLGTFKLNAVWALSPQIGKCVMFSGVHSTGRTLTQVNFSTPQMMRSDQQCAALIYWNLKKAVGTVGLSTAMLLPWLEMGMENQDKLPWVKLTPTAEQSRQ